MSEQNQQPPQNNQGAADVAALKAENERLKNYIAEVNPFIQDASQVFAAISRNPQLKETVIKETDSYRNPQQQQTQNQQNQNQNQQQTPIAQSQWKFDPVTGQPIQQQVQQPQAPQQQQPHHHAIRFLPH